MKKLIITLNRAEKKDGKLINTFSYNIPFSHKKSKEEIYINNLIDFHGGNEKIKKVEIKYA